MAIREPANAAITIPAEFNATPLCRQMIIVIATTSFAPEEIPSTYGPAIGFWKKLWSRKPDTDYAPAKRIDAVIRGRRIFQIIWYNVESLPSFPNIAKKSPKDILTLPTPTFHRKRAHNAQTNIINAIVYRFFTFSTSFTFSFQRISGNISACNLQNLPFPVEKSLFVIILISG